MSVVVTEAGFVADDLAGRAVVPFAALADGQDVPAGALAVDFPNDRDPGELGPWLDRVALVRIAFPAMGDGRGFSIARRLRAMGYTGRLRAAGPLIPDQFRAARRVGFDEVELPDEVAARQSEAEWRLRPQGSYQDHVSA